MEFDDTGLTSVQYEQLAAAIGTITQQDVELLTERPGEA